MLGVLAFSIEIGCMRKLRSFLDQFAGKLDQLGYSAEVRKFEALCEQGEAHELLHGEKSMLKRDHPFNIHHNDAWVASMRARYGVDEEAIVLADSSAVCPYRADFPLAS
jgi:hypothetical protein